MSTVQGRTAVVPEWAVTSVLLAVRITCRSTPELEFIMKTRALDSKVLEWLVTSVLLAVRITCRSTPEVEFTINKTRQSREVARHHQRVVGC
jgi:hypothetical protein